MEKNLLKNIYKLMILMRKNIYNQNNQLICEMILQIIDCKGSNKEMLSKLNKILDTKEYLNFFDFGNSEYVTVNRTELNILIIVLGKVKNSLNSKRYDLAYDLLDGLHILPEIMADNKEIDLNSYWKVYFKNTLKKYDDKDIELIRKCFKER